MSRLQIGVVNQLALPWLTLWRCCVTLSIGWRYAQRLRQFEEQHRLAITHGGGIEEMGQQIRARQEPLWRRRTFAVFDSDALLPSRPSVRSTTLGQICQEAGIAYHRLLRRSAENYLPPASLLVWANGFHDRKRRQRLKAARAFGRLNPQQRHHYNMKRGHRGDGRSNGVEPGRVLYEGLDKQTMQALDEGFGDEIGDLFAKGIDPQLFQQDDQEPEIIELFEALLEKV